MRLSEESEQTVDGARVIAIGRIATCTPSWAVTVRVAAFAPTGCCEKSDKLSDVGEKGFA